ncbi:transmembrane protein 87A-like [Clarias gariepinus]|uniref:transmembrane protein 87A-like n=1 Tax=Clarias gariepinus TaxID=13013 RepID=UPI00234D16CE|nr:transmembrane protein 87A-like [Clarias gariepinus]
MATFVTHCVLLSNRRITLLTLIFILIPILPLSTALEQGKWTLNVDNELIKKQNYFYFSKTMFNKSMIEIKWLKEDCNTPVNLSISWYLRSCRCFEEAFDLDQQRAIMHFDRRKLLKSGDSGYFITHKYNLIECKHMTTNALAVPEPDEKEQLVTDNTIQRRRRENEVLKTTAKVIVSVGKNQSRTQNTVAQTWEDSPYMFIIKVETPGLNGETKWSVTLEVSMIGPHQYISASEWPLMIFYMVMCIIYVLLGVLWLALSACYWRDLLRIQFWIGGVIFLGMLEKAVYYAEFQSIRYDGLSVQGAVVFAEVLSAVKRTLARVLVIIASLGYGIVKPRLGALLHRVVGVGLLYLSFSVVEGILRVNSGQGSSSRLLCDIVLAVTDSCIVWWIFISLAQTMKLLRLRRNVVKLSLYRHFTNTLIFAVIASVIFIIWTTKTFKLSKCQSDWREMWIDDAFWRFLFSTILLVIMFLWRPSANNQRYAFSPLVDEISDEEEAEQLVNEAFEGVKMRGFKSETNGSVKPAKVDEDLKWVEENIPTSMADVALPPLLDSDEEIMTTKFEMSKME